MPEFCSPFAGNKNDKKLTKDELIRAIRFSIASEFEAIQIYEQLKDSIDNTQAEKILDEVTEDEKTHVGNFLYLLCLLSKSDDEYLKKGKKEAVEIIAKDK